MWIQDKGKPSNSRVCERSSEQQWDRLLVWTCFCSLALELSGICSGPCMCHQKVDLKQINSYVFLQQWQTYLGLAESCNSGYRPWRATCKSPYAKEGESFCREKRAVSFMVSKESIAFHWPSHCKERRVFLSVGLCYCCRMWKLLIRISWVYLIEPAVHYYYYYYFGSSSGLVCCSPWCDWATIVQLLNIWLCCCCC